ncbi:hypothetical protein, conserved [Eimeria tenella]|uniref:Uncharacterized protein n=1 Tax=Eimeria tenella TaxID=5802 RepID=U6KUJ5_EIMTE|nr:hypothetical protein, conserved [Eimeria tenella]CDJ41822.1 hypothetical protein, conserved [Eimeria tenella]|eukprot:XP_013232572.1 hypothetical protein, conserved [Eimeria tenella]
MENAAGKSMKSARFAAASDRWRKRSLLGPVLLLLLDAAVVLLLLAAVFADPFPPEQEAAGEVECLYSCLFPTTAPAPEPQNQQLQLSPQQENATAESVSSVDNGGRPRATRCSSKSCNRLRLPAAAAAAATVELLRGSSGAAMAATARISQLCRVVRDMVAAAASAAAAAISRGKATASSLLQDGLLQHLLVLPRGPPVLMPKGLLLLPSLPPLLLPPPHSRVRRIFDFLPGLLLQVSFLPPAPRPRPSNNASSGESSNRRKRVRYVAHIPVGLSYLFLTRCVLLLIIGASYVALRRSCASAAAAAAQAHEAIAEANVRARSIKYLRQNKRREREGSISSVESDSSIVNRCSRGNSGSSSKMAGCDTLRCRMERELRRADKRRRRNRTAAARDWRQSIFSCLFSCCFAASAVSLTPLLLHASVSPSNVLVAATIAAACAFHASALKCLYRSRVTAAQQLISSSSRNNAACSSDESCASDSCTSNRPADQRSESTCNINNDGSSSCKTRNTEIHLRGDEAAPPTGNGSMRPINNSREECEGSSSCSNCSSRVIEERHGSLLRCRSRGSSKDSKGCEQLSACACSEAPPSKSSGSSGSSSSSSSSSSKSNANSGRPSKLPVRSDGGKGNNSSGANMSFPYCMRAVGCMLCGGAAAAAGDASLIFVFVPVLLHLAFRLPVNEARIVGATSLSHSSTSSCDGSCSRSACLKNRLGRVSRALLLLFVAAATGVLLGAAGAAALETLAVNDTLPSQQLMVYVYSSLTQRLQHAKASLLLSAERGLQQLLLSYQWMDTSAAAAQSDSSSFGWHKATRLLLWQREAQGSPSTGRISLHQYILQLPGGMLFTTFGLLSLVPLLLLPLQLVAKLLRLRGTLPPKHASVRWSIARFCWKRRNSALQLSDHTVSSKSNSCRSSSSNRETNIPNNAGAPGNFFLPNEHSISGDSGITLKSQRASSSGTDRSVNTSSSSSRCEKSSSNDSTRSKQGNRGSDAFIPWFICCDFGSPWLTGAFCLLLTMQQQGQVSLQQQQQQKQDALVPLLLPFCAVVAACGAAAGAALLQQIFPTEESSTELATFGAAAAMGRRSSAFAATENDAFFDDVSPAMRDVLEQSKLGDYPCCGTRSGHNSVAARKAGGYGAKAIGSVGADAASSSHNSSASSSISGCCEMGALQLLHAVSARLPPQAASAARQLRRASFACIEATLKRSPTLLQLRRMALWQKKLARRLLTPRAAAAGAAAVGLLLLFAAADVIALARLAVAAYLSPGGHALHALERLLLLHKKEMQAHTDVVPTISAVAAAGVAGGSSIRSITVPTIFRQLYDSALYPDIGEALPTAASVIYSPWIAAGAAAPGSAAAAAAASAAAAVPIGTLEELLQPLHPLVAVALLRHKPVQQEAIRAAACTPEFLGTHFHYFLTSGPAHKKQQQQAEEQHHRCTVYVAADALSVGVSPFASPPPSRCLVQFGPPGDLERALASSAFNFVITATPPDVFPGPLCSRNSSNDNRIKYCLLFASVGLAEVRLDAAPLLQLLGMTPSRWMPQKPHIAQQRWRLLQLRERDSQKGLLLMSLQHRAFVYYCAHPMPRRRRLRRRQSDQQ